MPQWQGYSEICIIKPVVSRKYDHFSGVKTPLIATVILWTISNILLNNSDGTDSREFRGGGVMPDKTGR